MPKKKQTKPKEPRAGHSGDYFWEMETEVMLPHQEINRELGLSIQRNHAGKILWVSVI